MLELWGKMLNPLAFFSTIHLDHNNPLFSMKNPVKEFSENNLARKDLLLEFPLSSFEKDEEANDQ